MKQPVILTLTLLGRKMSDLVADAGSTSANMWILDRLTCVVGCVCALGALRTFDFENVPVRIILNIK